VVAATAGSDYLFVPDRNIETVKAAVVSLQSACNSGAIFVSDKYGEIAGTLRMSLIKTENSGNGRAPDIIVSFSSMKRCRGGKVRRQLRQFDQPPGAITAASHRPIRISR